MDTLSSSNPNSSLNSSNVRKKEKSRIILAYYVFSLSESSNNNESTSQPSRSTVSPRSKSQLTVIKRYLSAKSKSTGNDAADCSSQRRQSSTDNELDEESIALLCLPDGSCTINQLLNDPDEKATKFHTFLITRQNGSRYYGSSLIVRTKCQKSLNVHCIITDIPFVTPTRQLLHYFTHFNPDSSVIQRVCNLRVPSKGKCLKLLLPPWSSSNLAITSHLDHLASPFKTDSRTRLSSDSSGPLKISSVNSVNNQVDDCFPEKGIYVYRGTADFPLLDYPLRQLFCDVISPQVFIELLTAALLEYQILLISNDYYKLMLISETLTSLVAPFTWQHVYVPILPVSLGLHYLDAPTPYIMGLNSDLYALQMNRQRETSPPCNRQSQQQQQYSHGSSSLPPMSLASLSVTHTSQVRLFCDENRIEFIQAVSDFENKTNFSTDLLEPPPFLHQLKSEIDMILDSNVKLASMDCNLRSRSSLMTAVVNAGKAHNLIDADTFSYLDDLKLNHLIRITCSTLLQHNLLREYQKFIVINEGDALNSASFSHMNGFKFDSGPFLSDQPDSLVPFMSKFLQTQMFASFIDEKCRKLKKSRAANLSPAVFAADPLVASIRRNCHVTQQDLKSIASSIDQVYDGAFEDVTIVDLNEIDLSKSCSSPRRQRRVYDKPLETFDLKTNMFKSTSNDHTRVNGPGSLDLTPFNGLPINRSPSDQSPNELSSALISETNWRIVESLLRETKSKTKRILLEKMSSDEVALASLPLQDDLEGNTLIASLCDLIERVWNHEIRSHDSRSSFWSYVTAYCDINSQSFTDSSDTSASPFKSNRLSVIKNGAHDYRRGQQFLSHSTPSSPMHRASAINKSSHPASRLFNSHLHNATFKFESTHSNQLTPLPTSLHHDVSSIASMVDVKTDHGKTRAFLRLALERKLLSSHLRTLCSNGNLLTSKYKRPAFLRAEEEREQFLTHLLTLNAVDLLCFTNTFTTSTLIYRFSIFSSGPVYGSFTLSGTLNDSLAISIEGNEMSFVFKSKNLGLIKSLTLTSFAAKVHVDYILIRNEITGHLFRFNCNKWFGSNINGDPMERTLPAEHITDLTSIDELIERTGHKTSSIGRQFKRGITFIAAKMSRH